MRYKIVRLQASGDEIVDIPNGCIPIEYSISHIERRNASAGSMHKLMFGDTTCIETKREVTVLQPIIENEEDVCFFCELDVTKDRICTKPICPKCLALIYEKARESHEPGEC